MEEINEVATVNYDKMLKSEISLTLLRIGAPAHIMGFTYLKDVIYIVTRDPNRLRGVTKNLYPVIAEKYNTTSDAVERTIRSCIKDIYKGGTENFAEFLGVSRIDPEHIFSNAHFIALVSEKIRINLDML